MVGSDITREEIDRLRERFPEELLTFTFSRSGGPGGQNVNKVNTRVTLLLDLDGCDALNETEKRRIRARLGGRISKDGHLRVVCLRHRTQRANREAAVERFFELLAAALHSPKPRRSTGVPARERRKRLEEKRRRGEGKRLRGERFNQSI